jgi:hypothetical protein
VKFDTPNQHTLDVLAVMRKDRKPYCIKDLVEHESVGGEHRKRAIEYGLERLEQQALVERCPVPAERKKKGRPPVYYRATGTNVPDRPLKKAVDYIDRKSVGKTESDCTGTDSSFPTQSGKINFRKNKPSSTPKEQCTTEAEGSIIPVDEFSEKHRKTQSPSTGTDLNLNADPWVNKQIDQSAWD